MRKVLSVAAIRPSPSTEPGPMDISLTALIAAQPLTFAPASPVPLPIPTVPTPAEVARPQDVVFSDAYFKRPAVHRAASVAILPLFALQVAAGTQLYANGSDAPQWAKVGHRVGATGVAALFVTNVVTGIPREVALTSVAIATIGYLSMLDVFRPD